MIGNEKLQQTRLWDPKRTNGPRVSRVLLGRRPMDESRRRRRPVWRRARNGQPRRSGSPTSATRGAWTFDGKTWVDDATALLAGLIAGRSPPHEPAGQDCGVRLRDLDHDGVCELLVSNDQATGGLCNSTRQATRLEASWRANCPRGRRSSTPRDATPACGLSTSTKTAMTTSFFPTNALFDRSVSRAGPRAGRAA